jgi:hypothetical protein
MAEFDGNRVSSFNSVAFGRRSRARFGCELKGNAGGVDFGPEVLGGVLLSFFFYFLSLFPFPNFKLSSNKV